MSLLTGLGNSKATPAPLNDAERDFTAVVVQIRDQVENLRWFRKLLDERLSAAERGSRACAGQIEEYLQGPGNPLSAHVEKLKQGNSAAFKSDVSLQKCADTFRSGIKDLDERIKALAEESIQTEMRFAKHSYEKLYQSVALEHPLGLKDIASRAAELKPDLESCGNPESFALVQALDFNRWNGQFFNLKTAQKGFLNADPQTSETQIVKFIKELDAYIASPRQLNPLQFTLLTDPVPLAIQEQWNALSQHYRDKFKALKETCVRFWNQSLLDVMVVEGKLLLIKDCKDFSQPLSQGMKDWVDFKTSLETLRHQYKGKGAELAFKGNHAHLKTKFLELKDSFAKKLADWKGLKLKIQGALQSHEDMQKRSRDLSQLAFATVDQPLDDFNATRKYLVENGVKGWFGSCQTKFQAGQDFIQKELEEIAFWMDVTDAVVKNPEWRYQTGKGQELFPTRTLFTRNIFGYYTPYTTFRDQLKA